MDQALLNELIAMKRRDEEVRSRLLAEGRLYGVYDEKMQDVHIENAQRLSEIVAKHGWPGISLVGIEGCRAAWFIAQHSICTPDAQRTFLQALDKAADAEEAPRRLVALLTDRIRHNEHRPQVYGTVLDWNDLGELSCEVVNPDQVDQRRAAIGLPPLEEDISKHRNEVLAEGGAPPSDLNAYKQRKLNWAKKVGWI